MVKRHYAIVTEEYKLIHFYYNINEWELYDRKKDKYELTNQYYNPKYKTVVDKLKRQLAEMRVKYKDSEALDQKYIDKYKELQIK